MKSITKRERLLLLAFSLLFGLVLMSGFVLLASRGIRGLYQENANLKQSIEAMASIAETLPEWMRREAWLDENVSRFSTPETAAAHLLEWVLEHADEVELVPRDVELVERTDRGEDEVSQFDHSSVRLTVAGDQQELLPWIHSLQQPERLIGVTGLEITSQDEFVAQIEVSLWYVLGAGGEVSRG